MTSPPAPTGFVVDDYPPVRSSISRLLRAAGFAVAAFASPEEFLAQYDPQYMPLFDSRSRYAGPRRSGTSTAPGQGRQCPAHHFSDGYGRYSKEHPGNEQGASDFLTKPVDDEELLAAVRVAIKKHQALRQEHADLAEIRARLDTLTPREREVLEYVVAGKLNKQIAGDLGTAEQTVKFHRAHVMQKMKAHSVAELIRLIGNIAESEEVVE